jgi:hypothetical protein
MSVRRAVTASVLDSAVAKGLTMFKKSSPLIAALLAGGLAIAGAAPAGAEVVERYSLDYSTSGVADNFCGSGLQPSFTYDQTGSGSVKLRDKGGPLWFHEKLTVIRTFTYDGMTVTDIQPNTVVKDQKIVDNGDGTLSITVLYAGGARLVGSDGKVLAKNDGQIRMLLTVDIALDTVVSEELIFGSTGTNDDFCEAILAHWGV